MKRRDFLKQTTIPTAALAVGHAVGEGASVRAGTTKQLPLRAYGKSDVKLSVIGFGGYLLNGMKQEDANGVVAESIKYGVNYFDVAPTYGDAEARLGPALEPFRKDVFLACKTTQRKADKAAEELAASLKRLRTDHVDLYQLHALRDVAKDVDTVFGKGGAMEAFLEAKKRGQVRFLGFLQQTGAHQRVHLLRVVEHLFELFQRLGHEGPALPETRQVCEHNRLSYVKSL